jgi:hypothetical protein
LAKWLLTGRGDEDDQIYSLSVNQAEKTFTDWDDSFSQRNISAAGAVATLAIGGTAATANKWGVAAKTAAQQRANASATTTILRRFTITVKNSGPVCKSLYRSPIGKLFSRESTVLKKLAKGGKTGMNMLKVRLGVTLFLYYELYQACAASSDAMQQPIITDSAPGIDAPIVLPKRR